MAFIWAGCMDGSSIDLNKVDAFTVGQVQKHDSNNEPAYEDEEKKVPSMQMCVFAIIGHANYPMRFVSSMHEGQLTIQSILGNMKKEYDKERGGVEIATVEQTKALKIK